MRVLIYGDSNSWGYLDDGLQQRFEGRWPLVFAQALRGQGLALDLVEECLSGRTTTVNDSEMGDYVNGLSPLLSILRSHRPLDAVLIMLGTNDFKARFNRSAEDIVAGLMTLAQVAEESDVGPGSPAQQGEPPMIGFISPPILGARADDPTWDRALEWTDGRAKSLALSGLLRDACVQNGYGFFDAAKVIQSSDIDPIHWDRAAHRKLGSALAQGFGKAFIS